jgi:hypothetical protein
MNIQFLGGESPAELVAKLRQLASDIESIVVNGAPSAAEMARAPVIDFYQFGVRATTGLAGVVSRHPHRPDGRLTMTSELFVIDAAAGWARTWSRFYALGRPAAVADRRPQ